MDQLINAALESRWHAMEQGLNLSTPDKARGSPFSITAVNNDRIVIMTDGGNPINITRNAFIETLKYLLINQHTDQNPCQIGSNKDINQAGPLCRVARNANDSNIMIINYLLPILAHMKLVTTDGGRPNQTWLV